LFFAYICPLAKETMAKLNWDTLGIVTSIACAIHCAVLPIALTSLPVFGINIIHNTYFEWGMIALAFFVGCYSLYHGFITHHKNKLPFIIFAAGFVFLVLKQFTEVYEYVFLAAAVPLIIFAHYYNYRMCHRSKCASPHHKH
jgi:ABC-type branched-subunit amino acid transport system permease subunit